MDALSPWAVAVKTLVNKQSIEALLQCHLKDYENKVNNINPFWVLVNCEGNREMHRPAYTAHDHLQVIKVIRNHHSTDIKLSGGIRTFEIDIQSPDPPMLLIRYTTAITVDSWYLQYSTTDWLDAEGAAALL